MAKPIDSKADQLEAVTKQGRGYSMKVVPSEGTNAVATKLQGLKVQRKLIPPVETLKKHHIKRNSVITAKLADNSVTE